RQLQWFKIGKELEVMDTPGILVPRIGSAEAQWKLALAGAVPRDRYDPEDVVTRFHRWLTEKTGGRTKVPGLPAFAQARGFVRRGLNDSKQVKPELRVELAEMIKDCCSAWSIGSASVAEIDHLNIYWASVLAMERALAALPVLPQYLITDAVRIKSFAGPQEPLIKGDARSAIVAAASIIAKVHRDKLLCELH